LTDKKQIAKEIQEELARLYPGAHTALKFNTAFQLMVATILSAQTTDRQVNKVTERLFRRYPGPQDFARLDPEQLGKELKGVGLHRNKSRFLVEASKMIMEKFNGKVPRSREELMQLPGVGRKTANVILSNAFGIPALGVDTHVHRVANRLGLVNSSSATETETQLQQLYRPEDWLKLHHRLIYHGRLVCHARNPKCSFCSLASLCNHHLSSGINKV